MIVTICQWNGQPISSPFRFGEFCKHKLRPGKVYWLYLYTEKEEARQGTTPCPLETNNLAILKRSRLMGQSLQKFPIPVQAGALLQAVQFKVDNDTPITKVIRWTFKQEQDEEYQTYRISLHVQPRLRTQLSLLVSIIGAFALAKIFDLAVQNWESKLLPGYPLLSLFLVLVLFLGLGYLFLKLIGWLYTPRE